MRFKRIWVHKHFFQSKMVLDILNKKEEEEDLEMRLRQPQQIKQSIE